MNIFVYVRFILGIICMLASLTFFVIEIMGVFKMKYVMNRMHSAAIGDAMALGLSFVGLMLLNGLNFTTFKLLLVPCFVFMSSPVSSHLIARMEIETDKVGNRFKRVKVEELEEFGQEDK